MRHNLKKNAGWVAVLIALLLLTPFASGLPDGLERVAINHGFIDQEQSIWHYAPFADYSIKAFGQSALSTYGAALLGTAVLLIGAAAWIKLKSRKTHNCSKNTI